VTDRHRDDLERVAASENQLDSRIMRGSAWVAVSYGGRNLVSLATMLALVRLLDPKAFGLVALAWIVLTICDQVQDAGTASALVYRRDDIERAAATTLVFSWLSSMVLYGIAFLVAPLVAGVFHAPELTDVLRVMALVLLARGIGATPSAILEREIDFRRRAKCDLGGALAQAAVSLALAALGAGVWSLVGGQLAGSAVQAAVAWLVVPWRPDPRRASLALWRDMIRYGRFVSAANVVNLANNTVDNVVIGRLLGSVMLGVYAVGFRLADFPNSVIGHIVGRVMFPIYALLQYERERFRVAYIQNLQRIAVFALPASVTLLVGAGPIVHGLLGNKWEPAILPLRILAVYGLVKSFAAPSGEVFKGAGRPHLGLVFGVAQIALTLPALTLLVPRYGLEGAAAAMLGGMAISGAVRLGVSLRTVGATFADLVRALRSPVLCSILLAATLGLLLPAADALGSVAGLAALAVAGCVVYVTATLAFARSVVVPMWKGLRDSEVRVALR
jgi:O-antigen/teichoic acid export membrane protein